VTLTASIRTDRPMPANPMSPLVRAPCWSSSANEPSRDQQRAQRRALGDGRHEARTPARSDEAESGGEEQQKGRGER
jgi:hypothetical protein